MKRFDLYASAYNYETQHSPLPRKIQAAVNDKYGLKMTREISPVLDSLYTVVTTAMSRAENYRKRKALTLDAINIREKIEHLDRGEYNPMVDLISDDKHPLDEAYEIIQNAANKATAGQKNNTDIISQMVGPSAPSHSKAELFTVLEKWFRLRSDSGHKYKIDPVNEFAAGVYNYQLRVPAPVNGLRSWKTLLEGILGKKSLIKANPDHGSMEISPSKIKTIMI